MKDVEYFTFMLPPDMWRKKPQPSKFKMDAEYAARVYPGSTPIPDTREVRQLPSTREELTNAGRTNPDSGSLMTHEARAKAWQDYDVRMEQEKQVAARGILPP